MSLIGLTMAVVLTQAEPAVKPAEPAAPAESSVDKAANAAQKAAEAAQKAAEAALRVAEAMAPRAAEATEKKEEAKEEEKKSKWIGTVGIGLTYITGNSQNLTLSGGASVSRTWDAWTLGLKANGAYGLANPDTNATASVAGVTARRAGASIRGDRAFGSGFASIFALAGSEFDHMKNIESRTTGQLGTGLTFLNTKDGELEKLYLRLDIAALGGYETRFQYFPAPSSVTDPRIVILAPRAAVTFRWNFSKDVRFSEELEFIPYLLAPTSGRLLINNNTKLSARLTEYLALTTGLLINFDSMPPVGADGSTRKNTDVALTVGLDAAF